MRWPAEHFGPARGQVQGLWPHARGRCMRQSPAHRRMLCQPGMQGRDMKLVTRYNFFILEVVQAWIDPARKLLRTIHHQGEGEFMVAGGVHCLPQKLHLAENKCPPSKSRRQFSKGRRMSLDFFVAARRQTAANFSDSFQMAALYRAAATANDAELLTVTAGRGHDEAASGLPERFAFRQVQTSRRRTGDGWVDKAKWPQAKLNQHERLGSWESGSSVKMDETDFYFYSFSHVSHVVRAGLFVGFWFGSFLLRLIQFLNGTNILAP